MNVLKRNDKKIKPYKGGLYGLTIKKNLSLAIVFAVVLFIAMPVRSITTWSGSAVTMAAMKIVKLYPSAAKTFGFDILSADDLDYIREGIGITSQATFVIGSFVAGFVSVIMCVVIACVLFRYMHNKVTLDTIHSLPVKRSDLFLSKYFAGITLINVPFIGVMLLTMLIDILGYAIVLQTFSLELFLTELSFLATTVLLQTALFTMAAFVAINTGTIFDMILSLFSINAAWPLMILLINGMFKDFVYGYNSAISFEVYFLLSPLGRMLAGGFEFGWFAIAWWTVFTVGLLFASLRMYDIRKSESAGKPFAFSPMKYALRVVVPVIVGLVGGKLFMLFLSTPLFYIIGFVLGSFTAYTITELIISRGFKHYAKSLILYGATLLCFAGFFYITINGLLGYEQRLPKPENISAVRVSMSLYDYEMEYDGMSYFPENYYSGYDDTSFIDGLFFDDYLPNDYMSGKDFYMTSDEAINTVYQIHKDIAGYIPQSKKNAPVISGFDNMFGDDCIIYEYDKDLTIPKNDYDYQCNYLIIEYKLKNGTKMTRWYNLHADHFKSHITGLMNNLEYNQKYNTLFNPPDKPDEYILQEGTVSEYYKRTGKPSLAGEIYFHNSVYPYRIKKSDVSDDYFDSIITKEFGETEYILGNAHYYYNEQKEEYYFVFNGQNYYYRGIELSAEQAEQMLEAYRADVENELASGSTEGKYLGYLSFSASRNSYPSADASYYVNIPIKDTYKNLLGLDFISELLEPFVYQSN